MSAVTSITGRAIPLRGDDIDTDRIIPARYLRCVTFDGLGEHVFEDERKQDASHPFNQDRYRGATILFVGEDTYWSHWVPEEVEMTLEAGKPVYAIRIDGTSGTKPTWLTTNHIALHEWAESTLQWLATRVD